MISSLLSDHVCDQIRRIADLVGRISGESLEKSVLYIGEEYGEVCKAVADETSSRQRAELADLIVASLGTYVIHFGDTNLDAELTTAADNWLNKI